MNESTPREQTAESRESAVPDGDDADEEGADEREADEEGTDERETDEEGTDERETDENKGHADGVEDRRIPTEEESVDFGLYEWGGGIAAGLGFFLTPLFTAPVACYCALRIRREKPISMYIILAIVLSTIVFWWIVLWSVAL